MEGLTFRSFPFGTSHSFTFVNKERYVPVRFLKRMDAQPCFNFKLIFKMCVGSGNSKKFSIYTYIEQVVPLVPMDVTIRTHPPLA